MKEANTNKELIDSVNGIGSSWAWKIPDVSPMHRAASAEGGEGEGGGNSFRPDRAIIPRAFDIIACVHGLMYAIEGKLIKGLGGLSIKHMTEFERRAMLAVEKAGGVAVMAIAYYHEATPAQMKKHNLDKAKVREFHLLRISDWMELERALPEGSQTVARADILSRSIPVQWLGKGLWDIEGPLYELHAGSSACSGWVPGTRNPDWLPFVAGPQGKLPGYDKPAPADADGTATGKPKRARTKCVYVPEHGDAGLDSGNPGEAAVGG